jgi:hypothetical protein
VGQPCTKFGDGIENCALAGLVWYGCNSVCIQNMSKYREFVWDLNGRGHVVLAGVIELIK